MVSFLHVRRDSNIPRVLDQCPAVGLQTRDGAADVLVNLNNLLHGAGLQKCARHSLLNTKYDALAGLDSDRCAAKFDGFEGVFDLEEAAFGREGARMRLERGSGSVWWLYVLDAAI